MWLWEGPKSDDNISRDVESSLMQSANMISSDFGIGVYSVPEAARMIGMGGQTLRRWLLGYDHSARDGKHFHSPLWSLQHERQDDEIFLGFRDLIEARIVNALRKSGQLYT